MDREDWWTTVHGGTKLSDSHTHTHTHTQSVWNAVLFSVALTQGDEGRVSINQSAQTGTGAESSQEGELLIKHLDQLRAPMMGPESLSTSLHWAASKGDLPCSPLKHSIYPGSHGQTLQVPPAGSWQGRNEWGGFTGAGNWGAHAPHKRGITSHSSCWPTLRNADPVWMHLPGTQESQKFGFHVKLTVF